MKSRTVIILWTLAIVLGITAYYVKFHGEENQNTRTKLAPGDQLFENLPIREIATVTITQGDNTTHLARAKDNVWGVKERDNYAINYELLRNLLGALNELEVTQGYPSANEHFARFGLADKNTKEDEKLGYLGAIKINMADADGSTLAEVYLGKYSGSTRVGGRFVRITGDDSGLYAVGQTFPGITADPKDWLSKDFIKIDQMKSISLSAPADASFTSWKLIRPNSQGQFTLDGMTANEVMQLTSTNAMRELFTYSAFQDVITEKQAADKSNPDAKLKRIATITTFDGLSYTLEFWPQKEVEKDPNADPRLPATLPSYNLTIQVSADFPKARNKSADESPEDSKRLDNEFIKLQKTARAKLAAAQAFQGRIYQISQSQIAPLQKKRNDFVKSKTPPSATTPPVRVPTGPAPTHPLQPLPPRR